MKKMNLLLITFASAMFFLLFGSCTPTSKKGVSYKQLTTDIESRTIKLKNGVEWDFNPRDFKPLTCFNIIDKESKISDSEYNRRSNQTIKIWLEEGKNYAETGSDND